MDFAYDNSKPGTQVKVRAPDTLNVPWGQYSCTLCGEPVRLFRGEIQKLHFRHERGSVIAQACEFYARNDTESSQDELKRKISGLPFYLKQFGDFFKLYIGFWPVDESTLAEEKRKGQKIIIQNENKFQIGVIDFAKIHANETYRLPISWVFDSYELRFEISGTVLPKIWGEKTSKLFSQGIFFRIGDIYSRNVSLNGVIATDTSYYLLSQDPVFNKSFLEVEESYSLLTNKTQKWKVYKIRFKEITRESTKYARDHHVQLLEKPPELIPLWPPSIQNNRKYIHLKTGLSTYRLNSSHNHGKWEVAILNQCEISTDKIEVSLKDPVFSIEVDNNLHYLSFFDTDNDLVSLIASDKKTISYQSPTLEMKWMKKQIVPGSELRVIRNADLSIKSDMKCDIIRTRNHIPDLIFKDKPSLPNFPNLSSGDIITIRHGLDTLASVYFGRTKKTIDDEYSSNLSDEALYKKLVQLKGTGMVMPVQLKYVTAGLGNYPITMEYLKKALKTGRISKQVADYFLKKYGQGEL